MAQVDEKRKPFQFGLQWLILLCGYVALALGILEPWKKDPPTLPSTKSVLILVVLGFLGGALGVLVGRWGR